MTLPRPARSRLARPVVTGLLLAVAAAGLSGCADDTYGVGYGYGYGPGAGWDYSGYYDGYYGPIYDGYWGDDGAFYYRNRDDDHHFHRGGGGHFFRNAPGGGGQFQAFHGHGQGGQGMHMPHFHGGDRH